jgi:outer membrane protein OmpA-like peptidoglycan-associated protein
LKLPRLRHASPSLIILTLLSLSRAAQAQNLGFAVERFEPTPAGEWTFAVDHPWYTRHLDFFAGGFTLDYAHDPLVFGVVAKGKLAMTEAVIAHALTGHVDLAGSFLDRVLINASLPVMLLERGNAIAGVSPLGGATVGDPRLGLMLRLFGQPLGDAFSIHLGADFWIPIAAAQNHAGDSTLRALPKLVLAGVARHVSWSLLAGYQYRRDASIGSLPPGDGNSVGPELRFGAALAYADVVRRFSIGPEATFATVVTHSHSFSRLFSSGEVYLGARYNIARQIELGVAGGVGLAAEPGTPDGRVIFRLAYAPYRVPPPTPPAPVVITPPADRDHDGVVDPDDRCPDEPAGLHPDPARPGCPLGDRDGDGVFDGDDRCVDVPAGLHPDRARPGCPDVDSDGDGVFDSVDVCRGTPAGPHPDPTHPGCPLPDRDNDQIPDADDACPNTPGAPDRDPRKNGCPGLVAISRGQIVIMKPVFFATDEDVILERSYPVLQAVADALVATPAIRHIAIEGHTDSHGGAAHNMELSDRRARSVMRFLIAHGVAAERLDAQGFGSTRPVSSNRSDAGRALNRRVEFHIIELDGQLQN